MAAPWLGNSLAKAWRLLKQLDTPVEGADAAALEKGRKEAPWGRQRSSPVHFGDPRALNVVYPAGEVRSNEDTDAAALTASRAMAAAQRAAMMMRRGGSRDARTCFVWD